MTEREEFEKWKLPLLRLDNAKRYFEKLETGEYAWHHIQCEWEAWQEQQKKIDEFEADKNETCEWYFSDEEEEDYYETECGRSFVMFEGTPKDANFIYCTYCGRKIKAGKQ
jgi:PHP family Zn ribbon phosphoesterase